MIRLAQAGGASARTPKKGDSERILPPGFIDIKTHYSETADATIGPVRTSLEYRDPEGWRTPLTAVHPEYRATFR